MAFFRYANRRNEMNERDFIKAQGEMGMTAKN